MSNFRVRATIWGCQALLLAERVLPATLIRLCVWPVAAMLAVRELTTAGPTVDQLQRLPASLRPPRSLWRLWRKRTDSQASNFVRFWTVRLRQPRWRDRCRVCNAETLDSILAARRPVILATLHYCCLNVECHWLRACGWNLAGLSAVSAEHLPAYRQYLNALADREMGMTDIPRVFGIEELWETRDFLAQPQRVLLVAVDTTIGKRPLTVHVDDLTLRVQTGAFRLAAISNAMVVPCIMKATSGMAVEIHFGNPIPEDLIADQRQHAVAAEHLLREFLPVVRECPELCSPAMLDWLSHANQDIRSQIGV